MSRAVILGLFLVGATWAGPRIQVDLLGMGTTGPYRLGYNHIIVGSEKIEKQGKKLAPGLDYHIDYDDGLVLLVEPLSLDDTLRATFSILPLEIRSSYVLMRPIEATEPDTGEYEVYTKQNRRSDQLEILGSKGFVINIGNRGEPSLSQSLDLDISGNLVPGLNIRGSVSDRNFASSSAGGTRSLDELDKVLLSLQAEGFRGDFGDLEIEGVKNSLLSFNRKLTGLSVSGNASDLSGSGALAFSPGQQVELFFFGVDGKQGPYFLQNPELAVFGYVPANSSLLPGTEEIFLDGKKLTRGNQNDYVIDYYEGHIEFTPKNVISSRSRITVKIQYAPEGYRRNFYSGNVFWEGNFKLGVQYLGESDDASRPRSFDMGNEQRSVISQAGASSDSAFISGIKYVGPAGGDYDIQLDSLGNSFVVYVGPSSGEYEATFSRVAVGSGDYEYAGAGRYVYVGAGNGAYLPLIYYPLPQSQNYGSIIFNKVGDFHFDGELAFSRHDRNSLSTKDELLEGVGFLGSGGWRQDNLPFAGKMWRADILNFRIRRLNNQFTAPGIIDPPEFFRSYSLPQNRTIAGERLIDFQSGASSASGDTVIAGGGIISGDVFESQRGFGKISLVAMNMLALSTNVEVSSSEDDSIGQKSDWNKYDAGVRFIRGALQPGLVYRHELFSGFGFADEGFLADELEASLLAAPAGRITSRSKMIFRKQKHNSNDAIGWQNQFSQYQLEQSLIYGKTASGFAGEVNVVRLFQERRYPEEESFSRNMGDLKINYNSPNFGLAFYESVNGAGHVLKAREFVYVGEGKGDYRQDGQDYVPEPGGDYIEVIRQVGEDQLGGIGLAGYEIAGGLRVRFDGRGVMKKDGGLWQSVIDRLNYEGDLSFRMNLAGGIGLKAGHLFLIGQIDSDEFEYRNVDFRQRMTYRFNRWGDFIRHTLNASHSRGMDFQFENTDSRRLANIAELKLSAGGQTSYFISAEIASEKSWLYSGNVDLDRYRIGLTPAYHPSPRLFVEIPLGFSAVDEKIRSIDVRTYAAGLRTVVNFRRIGRVEMKGEYSFLDIAGGDVFLPYVIASGRKQGHNLDSMLSFRFRLNKYSRLELRYTYKKLGDDYTNTNLRLEAKAEF